MRVIQEYLKAFRRENGNPRSLLEGYIGLYIGLYRDS